jgi:hypothetical protein
MGEERDVREGSEWYIRGRGGGKERKTNTYIKESS